MNNFDKKLQSIFKKYASTAKNGMPFMTPDDFFISYLKLFDRSPLSLSLVGYFTRIVDMDGDGLVSFEEFSAFEKVLRSPEALYKSAFRLLDKRGNGHIQFEDLKDLFADKTFIDLKNSPFILAHFGKDLSKIMNFQDFTQLIHVLQNELRLEAFRSFDKNESGLITSQEFEKIMNDWKYSLISPFVRDNLLSAARIYEETHGGITLAYLDAFAKLLSKMSQVRQLYLSLGEHNPDYEMHKDELLKEGLKDAEFTPLEIEILFQLTKCHRNKDTLTLCEIMLIEPAPKSQLKPEAKSDSNMPQVPAARASSGRPFSLLWTALEQVYRFAIGGVAGAAGAAAVYPIDLVKTRMQNQRTYVKAAVRRYANSWDCFRKVVRHEGVRGLYRGLLPQIFGVAPEKAIKLTANDFIKDRFRHGDGSIKLAAEVLAGGCAGGCQVLFTNPLEIVKIRLQVAGEVAHTAKGVSVLTVIRDLGLFGLYKGSTACFLRDIPFSAIYFPLYNHLKISMANRKGENSPTTMFIAATLAGAPAAFLNTPADVIKTRLQVVARQGQTVYSGVLDAARKIWREEGAYAFWKGSGARVFRSSPQFGVTLLTYEMLQQFIGFDFGNRSITPQQSPSRQILTGGQTLSEDPDLVGGYTFATSTFVGLQTKFGLCLPKFAVTSGTSP